MRRLGLCSAAAVFALLGNAAVAEGEGAMAMLKAQDGGDVGHVTLTQGPRGTLFHAELTGLAPGWHSFHVHETGSCTGDFEDAGGHYAPDENGHGLLHEEGAHAGDLPNIHVASDGTAMAEFYSARLSVAGGDAPLMDEDGSAIVIHEGADTYQSDAEAGARVACGVITQTK
ncbi:superoxide dismutase family protein [Pelagivirga sediminicola]|uniref:Superoxide dismutase family protein n=1 Tax=Pelagivirga sediminicola TaxID=2170575 RepID=A0A2T7G6X1_9RHOB|nr:superoxide dismutase family protein [Pelagivirga sediminicola]PVA10180.1 superoxide dismutase family protein [Pelagivirga sediminicola]